MIYFTILEMRIFAYSTHMCSFYLIKIGHAGDKRFNIDDKIVIKVNIEINFYNSFIGVSARLS